MPVPPDNPAMTFDPDAPAAPGSGLFGLDSGPDAGVWVLPVPFDATTSFRRGAALGPAAVLEASHQVDLYDLRFGRPWQAGIHTAEADGDIEAWNRAATEAALPVIEAGGVPAGDPLVRPVDEACAQVGELVASFTTRALDANALPIVLGGDHSAPFGAMKVCAERHPGLGILHVDAHADLRDSYEGFRWSHASILHNVLKEAPGIARLVQVGLRDIGEKERDRITADGRIRALFDPDWARAKLAGDNRRTLIREHIELLPQEVYVTFDVDGLDPSLCPNTGTPVPGGFDWHETMLWLEELVASGRRIVGCDLCEVNPGEEGGRSWDAIVGARLLYRLIGAALASRSW